MKLRDKILKIYSESKEFRENIGKKELVKSLRPLNGVEFKYFEDEVMIKLDKDSKKNPLSYVLARVPPRDLLDYFGENSLLWTWHTYCIDTENRKEIFKHYAKETGKDEDLLENCRVAMWRRYLGNESTASIKKYYELASSLNTLLEKIDIEKIIIKNSLEGFNKKILGRYSLDAGIAPDLTDKGGGWDPRYDKLEWKSKSGKYFIIYQDVFTGAFLNYDNKPAAVISFIPYKNNSLAIYQIQGIKEKLVENNTGRDYKIVKEYRTKGLFNLDWKKIMITINEELAKNVGLDACVISAINNPWSKEREDKRIHLEMEEAIKTYDDVPKSMGYNRSKDNNWYKKL
ncbi:MAG TPA: hypothetical protein VEC16_05095 [Alphaproteobacteria bacterium]|nr:hypothetical protein [Alphaproteobacteria bacterium]